MLSIEEFNQRVIAWLDQKWPQPRKCPICGQTEAGWLVGHPSELPISPLRVQNAPVGQAYVLVPVMCNNCKYELLFNGFAMQIFGEDGATS